MLAKLTGCLLLLCAFGVQQAKADSVYEVIGSMTIPGNSANPGVGETINYSFELDYTTIYVDGFAYDVSQLVGTPTVTSFGPLGTFYMSGGVGGQANGYMGFFNNLDPNVSTVEIDLEGLFHPVFGPQPVPFQGQGGALIWGCYAPSPCSEFQPAGAFNGPYGGGLLWNGANTSAVYLVSTPEPATLCLFALGALALGLVKKTLTI
jgi:hypothetical protein